MTAKCFKCAAALIELPEADPLRQSERGHYVPAFIVEVVGGGPAGGGPCRAAVICWTCMHVLDPDMWLSGESWDALTPAVPFEKLPDLDHDAENCWDVESYGDVVVIKEENCDDGKS